MAVPSAAGVIRDDEGEAAGLLAAADERCRPALAADVAASGDDIWSVPLEQTRLGALAGAAPGPGPAAGADPAAVAFWVQDALLARCRTHQEGGAHAHLTRLAAALQRRGFCWAPGVLLAALRQTQSVQRARPLCFPDLLSLPLTAAETRMGESPQVIAGSAHAAEVAALWRWFADRTDLRYRAWEVARMRRRIERLLPPLADDPYWLLTDACPLAARLREVLAPRLGRPDIAVLLRHCAAVPNAPRDMPAWYVRAAVLAAPAQSAAVLRDIGETALVHRPVRQQVIRQGQPVQRMVWAEPATLLLLYGVVPAVATVAAPWADELLAGLALTSMAVHPARYGRRPLLLRAAATALAHRDTAAAAEFLGQLPRDPARAEQLRTACGCVDPAGCPHGDISQRLTNSSSPAR
jgi:hypothetical protein